MSKKYLATSSANRLASITSRAKAIVTAQTAEIAKRQAWLGPNATVTDDGDAM